MLAGCKFRLGFLSAWKTNPDSLCCVVPSCFYLSSGFFFPPPAFPVIPSLELLISSSGEEKAILL